MGSVTAKVGGKVTGLASGDGGGAPAFSGALDAHTTDLWAVRWTTRMLSSYTGALIRVKRSSDNAETDVGYTAAGALDTDALLAHCGASIGYVTTMYDQTGNGRNLVQATAANQPKVCASGAIIGSVGEHVGIYFSGNDAVPNIYLVDSDTSALSMIELFGAVKNDLDPQPVGDPYRTGHPFCYYGSVVGRDSHYPWTDGTIYDSNACATRYTVGDPSGALTAAHMYNVMSFTNDWRVYAAGQTFTSTSNAYFGHATPYVGASNNGRQYQFNGLVAGNAIYTNAQASRATIRGLLLSGSG